MNPMTHVKAGAALLALAAGASLMTPPAAEAAPLGPVAKVEQLGATLAEPVWWRRHYRYYGYNAYPAYGHGCCYGGWGYRHHYRRW